MENYYKISSSTELSKIFDNAQDKLIVLMFFTRNNRDCRVLEPIFEKIASKHTLSIFCLINTDKFEGNSRYLNNLSSMPKFECFYMGNPLGSQVTTNEKEIESLVHSGENHVMLHLNKANSSQMRSMGQSNQMNQNQYNQIRQQILNRAQMSDMSYHNFLLQNPRALEDQIQKEYFNQGSNQPMQHMQSTQHMHHTQPAQHTQYHQSYHQQPPIQYGQPMPQLTQLVNPQLMQPAPVTMAQLGLKDNSIDVPSMQQMNQMFKIFKMLYKMGVLDMSDIDDSNDNSNDKVEQNTNDNNTVVLPNGDKLVTLPDGKYGLIKKSDK